MGRKVSGDKRGSKDRPKGKRTKKQTIVDKN
jgi:hypothetical protein